MLPSCRFQYRYLHRNGLARGGMLPGNCARLLEELPFELRSIPNCMIHFLDCKARMNCCLKNLHRRQIPWLYSNNRQTTTILAYIRLLAVMSVLRFSADRLEKTDRRRGMCSHSAYLSIRQSTVRRFVYAYNHMTIARRE